MAKNVQMTATIDEDVKTEASEILQELGLTMSTAIEVFLRQVIRDQGIPFQLSLVKREDSEGIKYSSENI